MVTNTSVCFAVQRSFFILFESVSEFPVSSSSLSTFLLVDGVDIIELSLLLNGGDKIELLLLDSDAMRHLLLDNDDVDDGVMAPKK